MAPAVGSRGLLAPPTEGTRSFSLPQDDVDEAADQRQREGHPRQDVGVAEGVLVVHPLRTHHRVDDGAAHHKQTWARGDSQNKGYALGSASWPESVSRRRKPASLSASVHLPNPAAQVEMSGRLAASPGPFPFG